jgi:hypothetical protein
MTAKKHSIAEGELIRWKRRRELAVVTRALYFDAEF